MQTAWNTYLTNRIQKTQKLLAEHALAALIVDKPIDIYYLAGKELSLGRLLITQTGATLFVDGRYYEACKGLTTSIEVILTSDYEKGSPFAKWWPWGGKKVGFDSEETSYAEYSRLTTLDAQFIPLKSPIERIREIKDQQEMEKLKAAAELGSKGCDFVCGLLKEGMSEKEAAVELEIFWLRAGGDKVAFAPHIAFGEGSAQPHYHSTAARRLKKGDTVLIDIGVMMDHYCSDMTRVVSFGEPPSEMKKIYQIVYEAHQTALSLCCPGMVIGDIDRAARQLIEKAGYHLPHGLGHGVGLEIHESPRVRSIGEDAKRPLMAGMVITIEPGIYVPGLGGVRLEDTILITPTGFENITARPFPRSLS